jgi:hypothetical protein
MAGIGDYDKKAKGSRGFQMKGMCFGNSPLKKDIKITTGFGSDADANLSKKVNKGSTSVKVSKKPTSTLNRVAKTFKSTAKQYAKKGLSIASKLGRGANVAGLVLGATTTATADQPKFKKGDTHYRDQKKSIF